MLTSTTITAISAVNGDVVNRRMRIARASWLRVETKYATYAIAFEGDRILGGAPYGMRVLGGELSLERARERLERMGARCQVLP